MKLLAIDASGLVASVAILEDETLLAEYTVNYKKTHSETLLPMISELCSMIELDLKSLDIIAVSAGPGSFTGLRIGSATAKGLADSLNIPIISVPTVDAMAYNLFGTKGLIVPIMDARREEVYTGIYRFTEDNSFTVVKKEFASSIHSLISDLNELKEEVTFLGDGVPVFRSTIDSFLEVPHYYAPPHLSRQRAGALGTLGTEYYKMGRYEAAASHRPIYLRKSQAERVREEKNSNA